MFGLMLRHAKFAPVLCTTQPDRSREFYVEKLGLEFVRQEPRALVLRGDRRYLRLQVVDKMPASFGAAFGWEVEDLEAKVEALARRGVHVERYEGLPQNERGIATFGNGDRVAWFLDPDGNVLSLAELVPA